MTIYRLRVNSGVVDITTDDPDMPLLYALRDDLGLRGPKFGCGLGQCGSCTVLLDGDAVRSCQLTIENAAAHHITTLEGLGTDTHPHPVQAAFIEEQAGQCAYCSNGMIITAVALLTHNPHPSDQDIRDALATNLCRCGAHDRILRAVRRAAA